MDLQISGFLSKYSYLGEDASVEAVQETGEPLRCIYYHDLDNNSTAESDVNALYFAYNYYCTAVPTTLNGRPINKCQYKADNAGTAKAVYATKNSYAYYKEAYDRLEADELKIINFEQTNLYKNKISKLGLSESYTISADDVSDLMSSLGISPTVSTDSNGGTTYDLFSINVAPPMGSGSLTPSGLFEKAHSICMGEMSLPKPATSGLTATQINNTLRG